MLNRKYMPSVAAEAAELWIQFEGLRQRGRPMQEHINECMTVRNKLLPINEPVPDRQFIHKLLNVDKVSTRMSTRSFSTCERRWPMPT